MRLARFAAALVGLSAIAMGAQLLLDGASAQESGPEKKDGKVVFRHVLDNEPIEFEYMTGQTITEAVETFHQTAENPYSGEADAIADGEKIYARLCVACHLKDGTGRIGPNLVDDKYGYERTATDKGEFEIIYAGGAGAMQAFGRRITQDDILRVMAYLEELKAKSGG
ncbi:MAG: c-type cytochrome [Rhodomicrobiaceae bacterium]